jgi:rhodanese-related sulfurtransferase
MPAPPPIEISCQAVHAKREAGDDFLLLDCRELDEYQLARIEGARLLPMSEIEERLGELRAGQAAGAEQDLVVHCHHGGRSLQVAQWLRLRGFPRAQSMAGGIDQWSNEIDPAVPRY